MMGCTCYTPWLGLTPPPPCPVHRPQNVVYVYPAAPPSVIWNGPICPKCGPYLGSHTCPPEYVGKHRKELP